ncbi:hypothetical protein N9I90_03860 [Alphaproteobacteria bacterium]|nr:hypothetical protein [Alphaproteobacteria bacterium]
MRFSPTSNFLFRVSTDQAFGTGHIARLLALRFCLSQSVTWFTDLGGRSILASYIPEQDSVIEEAHITSVERLKFYARETAAELLVCDSYNVSCGDLREVAIETVYFCDYYRDDYPTDFTIINYQPNAAPQPGWLTGVEFMPFNTRGKRQAGVDFRSLSHSVNCLVGFGSIDTNNITSLALSALCSDENLRNLVRPICLLGPYFKQTEAVKKLLKSFPDARLITDSSCVLDVPIACPLAIGAPGVSHAERLYMGAATVLVPQISQHEALCKGWQDEGCAMAAKPNIEEIASKMRALIANNFEKAEEISRRGQAVIDGKGASRIAKKILES